MSDLEALEKKIAAMSDEERRELSRELTKETKKMVFIPNPGPQTQAYFSEADVLLFGGCVSADTQYLSRFGWKNIKDYAGEEIAQWKDGALEFIKPEYVDLPCSEFIKFSNSRVSMLLSPCHRMPLYDWKGAFTVKTASEIEAKPSRYKIPVNYTTSNAGIPMSDNMLRLAVAIHADGNLYVKENSTAHCRISLRKQRKKDRLLELLTALDIPWKEYHNPKRPTEVRYSIVTEITTKDFSGFWWNASQRQLEIILEEISHWDGLFEGTRGGDITYYSKNKVDADFVQYAAHACGRVATIGVRVKKNENHSVIYQVSISQEGSVKSTVVLRGDAIDISRVKTDRMYCFTTPSSFWLARHDDFVFVTGNSPGGGKSVLEIGLALNSHHRSLIVRQHFSDLEGLIDNAKKIVGSKEGFVGGTRPKYNKPDGGVIHFAGLADDGGIGGHQGVDHDLICVDEAANVPENQIRLLLGWLRSDRKGQRTRMVLGSNPPLDSTGDWMIKFFAPWLDPAHPNPAKSGELRYFLPDADGNDVEVEKGAFTYIHGVQVFAQSRTFIPSKFTDNPYYNPEEYAKALSALPKEAREILISGNFLLNRPDSMWQLIPKDWVKQAVARWNTHRPTGAPMSCIGVDCAQGGADSTVLARRYGGWYDTLIEVPGKDTPEGKDIAALVVKYRRDGSPVVIDMGGGYGSAAKEQLESNGIKCVPYKGTKGTDGTVKGSNGKGQAIGFPNIRSEAYWRFREALDPSQPGGSRIALPDNQRLISELCTPEYRYQNNKYKVESKEEVVARLKRSTDFADSVVMAWHAGEREVASYHPGQGLGGNKPVPKVIMGHMNQRRPTRR